MFDDLFGNLESSLTDIVESDTFQAVIYVVVAYIVLIWLASAFWAYRDMRLRSASVITPYVAALAIIIFTPVFFLFGLLLYRIVRPKETIAEVNERALAEEAMLAEVASHAHCANCQRPVNDEWIICPTCRNRLRRVCPNCEHLIELDWTLCAWCGKDFERAEAAGTTAYMPIARPAPPPQLQQPQRMPAPPPPAPSRPAPPPPAPNMKEPSKSGNPAPAQPSANPTPPSQPQGAPSPAPRSSGAAAGSASTQPGPGSQPPGNGQPGGSTQPGPGPRPTTGI